MSFGVLDYISIRVLRTLCILGFIFRISWRRRHFQTRHTIHTVCHGVLSSDSLGATLTNATDFEITLVAITRISHVLSFYKC